MPFRAREIVEGSNDRGAGHGLVEDHFACSAIDCLDLSSHAKFEVANCDDVVWLKSDANAAVLDDVSSYENIAL